MSSTAPPIQRPEVLARPAQVDARETTSADHDRRHPISRWYLLPVIDSTAARLTPSRIRPTHVTLLGATLAAGAVAALLLNAVWWMAPLLVMAAWCCDRLDGRLARLQGTATPLGAWLDANLDELTDLALQSAVAAAASTVVGNPWPWALLLAFVAGKYLLFIGTQSEHDIQFTEQRITTPSVSVGNARSKEIPRLRFGLAFNGRLLRRLYHMPGNADVRLHWLLLCLAGGWFVQELTAVAIYYNLRWIVRYALVAHRLRGAGDNEELSTAEDRA